MLRQMHLQAAVTYVYVSALACKFSSLPCRLFQRLAKRRLCQRFEGASIERSLYDCIGEKKKRQLRSRAPEREDSAGNRQHPARNVPQELSHYHNGESSVSIERQQLSVGTADRQQLDVGTAD